MSDASRFFDFLLFYSYDSCSDYFYYFVCYSSFLVNLFSLIRESFYFYRQFIRYCNLFIAAAIDELSSLPFYRFYLEFDSFYLELLKFVLVFDYKKFIFSLAFCIDDDNIFSTLASFSVLGLDYFFWVID